jgi:hypothetical protein
MGYSAWEQKSMVVIGPRESHALASFSSTRSLRVIEVELDLQGLEGSWLFREHGS